LTIDVNLIAKYMFAETPRTAACGAADVTGAVGIELGNILNPFLLEIFMEWHYVAV